MKTVTAPKKQTNVLVITVPVVPKGRTSQALRTRTVRSKKHYTRQVGKRVDY